MKLSHQLKQWLNDPSDFNSGLMLYNFVKINRKYDKFFSQPGVVSVKISILKSELQSALTKLALNPHLDLDINPIIPHPQPVINKSNIQTTINNSAPLPVVTKPVQNDFIKPSPQPVAASANNDTKPITTNIATEIPNKPTVRPNLSIQIDKSANSHNQNQSLIFVDNPYVDISRLPAEYQNEYKKIKEYYPILADHQEKMRYAKSDEERKLHLDKAVQTDNLIKKSWALINAYVNENPDFKKADAPDVMPQDKPALTQQVAADMKKLANYKRNLQRIKKELNENPNMSAKKRREKDAKASFIQTEINKLLKSLALSEE